MEYEDFLRDYKTQDAAIRNIEILGEAAKLLSDEIKRNYPNIPWKDITGTRDKLIHDYSGVNIDIVQKSWPSGVTSLPWFRSTRRHAGINLEPYIGGKNVRS